MAYNNKYIQHSLLFCEIFDNDAALFADESGVCRLEKNELKGAETLRRAEENYTVCGNSLWARHSERPLSR